MTEPGITVYGAYWCPDCRRAKKFLAEQFISYNWVDIEQDPDGEQFVIQKNGGKRIIPTIVFADGSFLTEPSNAVLARNLLAARTGVAAVTRSLRREGWVQ